MVVNNYMELVISNEELLSLAFDEIQQYEFDDQEIINNVIIELTDIAEEIDDNLVIFRESYEIYDILSSLYIIDERNTPIIGELLEILYNFEN